MKLTHTMAAIALLSSLASAQEPYSHDPTGHGQSPASTSTSINAGQPSRAERKSDFAPAGSAVQKQFKTTTTAKKAPVELERHYMLKRDPFKKKP